jgi:hypothetical protein
MIEYLKIVDVVSVNQYFSECVFYLLGIRKVKMHIHSNSKVTRIYNVIGTLRGAVEPGK